MILRNDPIMSVNGLMSTLMKLRMTPKGPQHFIGDMIGFTNKNTTTHRVVVYGSNPSTASSSNNAFEVGTKSRSTVDSWFKNGDNYFIGYENLSKNKTEGNKPLSNLSLATAQIFVKSDCEWYLQNNYKIVGCGKTVHDFLNKIDVPHFNMPHPSGLNRFWNDPIVGQEKIDEMIAWIRS